MQNDDELLRRAAESLTAVISIAATNSSDKTKLIRHKIPALSIVGLTATKGQVLEAAETLAAIRKRLERHNKKPATSEGAG